MPESEEIVYGCPICKNTGEIFSMCFCTNCGGKGFITQEEIAQQGK